VVVSLFRKVDAGTDDADDSEHLGTKTTLHLILCWVGHGLHTAVCLTH
jgi:hypothetical protein